MGTRSFSIVLLLALAAGRSLAHIQPADSAGAVKTDTLRPRSAEPQAPRKPLPLLGSINRSIPPGDVITDSAMAFTDYRYLGDLLWLVPGVFIREFGTPGQAQQLSLAGSDPRSVQFLQDGIPLNDSYTGQFALELFPTEAIGRIERVTGPLAFLYELNAAGGAVNLVTRSRRALHPYSRIRYSESGYGYSTIDGMVSQDIVRALNVTAGVLHNTFGGRFPNSQQDHWSGRIKLRYNLTNSFNVFASEVYHQTYLGLWGGVDTSTPPEFRYDRIQATIRNGDAYEKVARHDVQAGMAVRPGEADSNAITTLTFFYSTQLREYRDEENRRNPNGFFLQQNQDSRWYGIRLGNEQAIGAQRFTAGGEVINRRALVSPAVDPLLKTQLSAFAKADLALPPILAFSPSARLDHYLGFTRLSGGCELAAFPNPCTKLSAAYSSSCRYLTLQEYTHLAAPGSAPERQEILEGGLRWGAVDEEAGPALQVRLFRKRISDAVGISPSSTPVAVAPDQYSYSRVERIDLRGCAAGGSFRAGSFVLEGEAQYLDQAAAAGDPAPTLPRWSAAGGLYFWDTLAGSHLHLKAGLKGRAYSSYFGREFSTLALTYLPGGQGLTVEPAGTLDFVLLAHLGDATIHLVLENLLDRRYTMNTFYPMLDRILRFGLSWEFAN